MCVSYSTAPRPLNSHVYRHSSSRSYLPAKHWHPSFLTQYKPSHQGSIPTGDNLSQVLTTFWVPLWHKCPLLEKVLASLSFFLLVSHLLFYREGEKKKKIYRQKEKKCKKHGYKQAGTKQCLITEKLSEYTGDREPDSAAPLWCASHTLPHRHNQTSTGPSSSHHMLTPGVARPSFISVIKSGDIPLLCTLLTRSTGKPDILLPLHTFMWASPSECVFPTPYPNYTLPRKLFVITQII